MLKPFQEVEKAVRSRFDSTLPTVAAHEATQAESGQEQPKATWPLRISLGRPRADELANHMDEVSSYVSTLREWSETHGLTVKWSKRIAGGTQEIPTHVVVDDIDAAARVIGREAARQLAGMRARAAALHTAFPDRTADELTRVLTQTRMWDTLDFELLVEASTWFKTHETAGLTPRQVPLAGFHAKWLNAHRRQSLIRLLAGLDTLGLVEVPAAVEVAYLDPTHLARGGRRYDLYVAGDHVRPPYEVTCALVVENKDTYRYFPEATGAVCVFGSGSSGPSRLAALGWLAEVPHLVYWGDMDADGLAILDDYRASGFAMESILMDMASYERYERLGTSRAASKQALSQRKRRELSHLTDDERDLYLHLTDPGHRRHRRVEQERIPLDHAKARLEEILGKGHEG